VTPPSLQNCVGGNPAIFHFPTSISSGFQFGKSARALNPVPPIQLKEPQITPALADSESGSGSVLSFVAGKYWIATISSHGSEEAELCQRQRVSVNMLSHVWHASSMEDLVEQTLSSLNFPEVHPIGMSQQFESQRNNPRKILYVQGSTICSLYFCILAPVWDTAASFIELNLRLCPNALLSQIQAEYHPRIFCLIPTEHLGLLSILQRLAGATHPLTRG